MLVFALVAWAAVVGRLHYLLPTPVGHDVDPTTGAPVFNEVRALDIIRELSVDIGYRIVGTCEMNESETYLLDLLHQQKRTHDGSPLRDRHEMEIWHQRGTGSHLFELIGRPINKRYSGLTNIIVRVSNGTPAGKADAVLVNAHLDSTLPSPGAADDLAGVVVMLELIRHILSTDVPLDHAIIFLFNGGEESLQDASQMYITQHETRHTCVSLRGSDAADRGSVRSVINLEACGVAGPEILFQATSTEMIKAYSHAPWPYGSVLASEIFSTGLLSSDTDFVQFQTHGNLTGLDMALVGNSYLYHTRLDLPEHIEPGALTHMHDNTLAILRYLTGPEAQLQGMRRERKVTYFNFLGPVRFER